MHPHSSVLILGLGSWGQTLSYLFRQQGCAVRLWGRSQGALGKDLLDNIDLLVSALPIKAVRDVAQRVAALQPSPDVILVSATKGLEAETVSTAADIWQTYCPNQALVVLSGPNLAAEIQQGLPAAAVVGGQATATKQVQDLLGSATFRLYSNEDRRGVEMGGIFKNVIAIACGVNDGLGLGVNARSALITRGLVEMVRVGCHWGGEAATFYGLSGLGDLLATCTSSLSRNYQVGWHLGQGKSLPQALELTHGTAEGVNTALVLYRYAQHHGLEIPITAMVAAVLQEQLTPQAALTHLLERPFKPETTPC
ncbi:NAD(P)H-dependent glycerol-3-phosphate dehydrogenase [Synechococcus sp. PCC 6717]|jgi:glycerol-3-phosphate dehydrogenase (NAD(P)+)|uniref:Glycerol-3-phosphate dehydrogenase [NAD(P)+] n=1 Tax=Parathermosynechococcus lividus PCC 6715 TaxID=1917166 RepID=A0A2D2Q3W1_PARLV|nr:NAD(P)H-dependent glycerol-3-phosphate dehydrogenase [Thermostichus lividus]ATS19193.1 glycerol-3-phosphate dehydrogenase [Thermostichus lividus PCC 6715]MCI3279983.1 NAD(P)H-dependent glycerol-3-phosphate dehydrogenase [Synechococcus sp. PCC 6717]